MVWLNRSPIPVGRRGVISLFKWFLPAFPRVEEGGGIGALWLEPHRQRFPPEPKRASIMTVVFGKYAPNWESTEVGLAFCYNGRHQRHFKKYGLALQPTLYQERAVFGKMKMDPAKRAQTQNAGEVSSLQWFFSQSIELMMDKVWLHCIRPMLLK